MSMLDKDLENSIVTQIMRDGMPGEDRPCLCDICKQETDELAVNMYGEVVGCRECITFREPWEIGR